MEIKSVVIWFLRIVGLIVLLKGVLTELLYLSFSWTEYPLDWYFYPLIYIAVGLVLMISVRPLVLRLEKLVGKHSLP